jgi:hypothetical protein
MTQKRFKNSLIAAKNIQKILETGKCLGKKRGLKNSGFIREKNKSYLIKSL